MAKKKGILVKSEDYDKATSALRKAKIFSSALSIKWYFHLGSVMLGVLIGGVLVALAMHFG